MESEFFKSINYAFQKIGTYQVPNFSAILQYTLELPKSDISQKNNDAVNKGK